MQTTDDHLIDLDHATSGTTVLRPYVPRMLIQWISEEPECTCRDVEGSVVFVDISGFTALSERLSKKGKVGAEELTDVLGACFTQLLAITYGNGGSLLKFGGDALLLLFTGNGHPAKACRAAVGMRRTLREIGRLESLGVKANLRMSVGVHSGTFSFFLVGNSHRELIVTGPAATETVTMEGAAVAGEILVSKATAAALPARVLGEPKDPGVLLKSEPPGTARESSTTEADVQGLDLNAYVPLAVRSHVLGGGEDPEHRRATVAFIHFDETDEYIAHHGMEALAGALHELVSETQAAVDEQGITFLGSDIDKDGGKLILVAGTPRATENDDERMLRALRRVADARLRLPIRFGVNRGPVFAGDIGPPYRRTYTVMGDTVNLAARLMATAKPGAILATEGVLDASATTFQTEALEPFFVKGKAKPVQAYAIGPVAGMRRSTSNETGPLIGRDREMTILAEAIDSARERRGRLIEIVGRPGMGKSRLLREIRASAPDLVHAVARCELYEASTAYFPWKRLLRQLVGIGDGDSPEEGAQRLRQRVASSAPELVPWLPLIGMAIDLPIKATPETSQLDEKFRRERLHQVVAEFLDAVLPACSLLEIDDVHWMDEPSRELLRSVAQDVGFRPWAICVTRREVETGFVAAPEPTTISLHLEPLAVEDAAELLSAMTEESPFPPHEVAALAERSGGNPLFIRELVAAARNSDAVEDLPDSLEGVVNSQIDRLAPKDRLLLRQASVLGSTFTEDLLEAMLPEETPVPGRDVWSRLGDFIDVDDRGFRFRNALIRDAAYEGLPFRKRRDLHARVGASIERAAGGDVVEFAEVLSLHYFYAQRYVEAWIHSKLAGDRARAKYANVEAAAFYSRALAAARRFQDVPQGEIVRVTEALGDAHEAVGEFGKAGEAYRSARKLLAADPVAEARIVLKEAWIPESSGRYQEALRWVRRGHKVLDGDDSPEGMRARAQLTVCYAAVRQAQGHPTDAIRWCERAIAEAETAGDRSTLAHASYIWDWALVELGRFDEAVHSQVALRIYEELGDLTGQAVVLNNSGTFAYWQGRWDEALSLYERGRDARRKTGNEVTAAMGTSNIAEILSDQGRLEEAERLMREALRVWRAADYRAGIAFATSHLGRIASRSGNFEEALRLLEEARGRWDDLGGNTDVLETDAKIAECHLFAGNTETALELSTGALERVKTAEGLSAMGPLLLRVKSYALMQASRLEEAAQALDESLSDARERGAEYEIGLTLEAMSRLKRQLGEEPDAAMELEYRGIFNRLGVRSTPEVPLPVPA
jgi:class 3 adenylate cyclase/tetratricopeptide (TPR) repeat protein